ncbi:hypothetical protein GCM10010985_59150 [Caballeronia grimmiae]|uniref:Uncharacterized protein n=1 Tax=Caballeronia grimmiae TaxID=1071679 RepID=A0ABQ1S936_9BURK|nr:hypothetical protein GCM10010985_59150 [Caballeronia grimmiae]
MSDDPNGMRENQWTYATTRLRLQAFLSRVADPEVLKEYPNGRRKVFVLASPRVAPKQVYSMP